MERNIRLYPYFQALRSLYFWQASWFLYFDGVLSAPEAILLNAVLDVAAVVLEVPSGYLSDAVGRRPTLIVATLVTTLGCCLLAMGDSFWTFALGQICLGAGIAFTSGTDNALLYDSLLEVGSQDQVAQQEARAWRFTYGALAASAAVGGILALSSPRLAYWVTALASFGSFLVVLAFREPGHGTESRRVELPVGQLLKVFERLRDPILLWVFVFMVGGYVFSHVPFLFAQPYLKEIMDGFAVGQDTPLVMGFVIAAMMTVSVVASRYGAPLRARLGLARTLILASSIEASLIVAMALIAHPIVVGLLLLRMVPNALSRPFVLEVIQPRLASGYRATYLSMQSLVGRLMFAASQFLAAWAVVEAGRLDDQVMGQVMPYYALAAIALVIGLALTAQRTIGRIDIKNDAN